MPISVDVRDPGVDGAAVDRVFDWLRHVDEVFSTYIEGSEISRLGRGELALEACSAEVRDVVELCEWLREATDGYFDARADHGWLDPSGVVKGWSVERASALLAEAGSVNHCINAAGDVRVRGEPEPGRAWQIGLLHPQHPDALTTVVSASDTAVVTSGTYERGLHVFDPHTFLPADQMASVTVVGPDLTFADAYATAALARGLAAPAWLATLAGHEAYLVDTAGHAWWTAGFAAIGSGCT
ncbi:MAG: FAD:protein FMN transferase [Actinomycetota bacterium]|nr:FAD:protein FMN transferase [Actinomycetota bacterium]